MTFGQTIAAILIYGRLKKHDKTYKPAASEAGRELREGLSGVEIKALNLLVPILLTLIGGFILFGCSFHYALSLICLFAACFVWYMIKSIYADAENRQEKIPS
jgi:hypothetical protein